MMDHFPFYLTLIIAIVLLVVLADKIKVAYPVVLVVAGLLISFIPGIPVLHIEPELIFIIFLPPLLYDAAFAISWKELWKWRRIISSFAFIVVFFTACSVAIVADLFLPGITLAIGFLLGGIVSPPDAVSASAILKFVKVPRRVSSILEGESLLNDASSLIIFRFAMLAVATGQFIWLDATLSFLWMVIGGAGMGLLIGWLFMKTHRLLPKDANLHIVMSLVAPYVMYIAAEEVHSSGILSVVSGGLFLSSRRNFFLDSSSRVRGANVWESLVFVFNGLVFLLIGLDLPEISEGLKQEGISLTTAISYGLLITAVLIIVRFIASFGALVVTKIAARFITVADRNPGTRGPIVLGWAGMRGVVSLAAALSIPVEVSAGVPFPHRNLILFITFIVIITTLLLQGLTLPYVIKKVNLPDYHDYMAEDEAESLIKSGLAENTLQHINAKHGDRLIIDHRLQQLAAKWEVVNKSSGKESAFENKEIHYDILELQRQWLLSKNKSDNKIDEEVIRKFLYQIDLEEEKIRNS
jgi:CPA1 family monovalent cation:H+ antiporter